jgi:hypothetical protein
MRCWSFIAVLAVLVPRPTTVQGWGNEGHRTVAVVAQQQGMLTANALAGIKTLVGNVGLVPLSTCPDEVRTHERNPSFVLSPECLVVFPSPQPTGTANWHFINLDVAKSDPKDAPMDAFCNERLRGRKDHRVPAGAWQQGRP